MNLVRQTISYVKCDSTQFKNIPIKTFLFYLSVKYKNELLPKK